MAQRWRMTFLDHAGEAVASLWCLCTVRDGVPCAALLYDYPDFAPVPGWRVEHRGLSWEITAVDGRHLSLALKEV